MFEIIQNSEKIIEISNNIIIFKFFKQGPMQGMFELIYSDYIILKDCYSNIIFHEDSKEDLIEVKSTQTSYISTINEISTEYGKGYELIINPSQRDNLEVPFDIQIELYEDQEFILLNLTNIEDRSNIKRRVHSISPFTVKDSNLYLNGLKTPTNLGKITWFKNGFQSWSPSNLLFGFEEDAMGPSIEVLNLAFDNQDYHIKGRFYSEYNTVITDLNSKNSLIIGFVTHKDQFTRIIMDYKNVGDLKLLSAFGCMDGVKFPESTINSSETLFIGFKTQNKGYYGLIEYAKVVNSKIENALITKIPVGWCSWYYYYTEITEKDMIDNLNFFHAHKDIPIDFIQLDDGYFSKIGDYLNIDEKKFPNGLEFLFSQIKKYGFKTGIWTAPFLAVRTSKLFKNHRGWFLTKNHKPLKVYFNWNSFEYALDLTKDEVLNYLSDLYSKFYHINRSVTMDFFKIDFLHAAVPYGVNYSKKTLTRAQILYQGIKKIRETITPDSFLLGCGAPLGPCIGLVDAMRISEDTAPIWDSGFTEQYSNNRGIHNVCLKAALINILYRSFMHNYFWINDPDCLMIRRKNTELTLDEIRLQMTIFGLSGGQLLISDDMTKLSQNEINDAKMLLPPYNPEGFDPIVLDAFQNPLPTIYMLETNEIIGSRFLVAIINWNDEHETKGIQVSELLGVNHNQTKKYLIFSFWDKRYIGIFESKDKIDLSYIPPHSCAYLTIIPLNKDSHNDVIFISSDLHISQGCCEIKEFKYLENKSKIIIKVHVLGNRIGSIYIKIPIDKKVVAYEKEYEQIDDQENIWKFHVVIEKETLIEIILS
ncbi:MAG: alpha-galactosidase [Promethearchaeota archaeon]|nr:MAG: alpha-galactosidase [Candidatus Lokiarchaeota archaeon]